MCGLLTRYPQKFALVNNQPLNHVAVIADGSPGAREPDLMAGSDSSGSLRDRSGRRRSKSIGGASPAPAQQRGRRRSSDPGLAERDELEVVRQTREILEVASERALKAVDLANALRNRVGVDVLGRVREAHGGLLSLLERHRDVVRVRRVPKHDIVSLAPRQDALVAGMERLSWTDRRQFGGDDDHAVVEDDHRHNNYDDTDVQSCLPSRRGSSSSFGDDFFHSDSAPEPPPAVAALWSSSDDLGATRFVGSRSERSLSGETLFAGDALVDPPFDKPVADHRHAVSPIIWEPPVRDQQLLQQQQHRGWGRPASADDLAGLSHRHPLVCHPSRPGTPPVAYSAPVYDHAPPLLSGGRRLGDPGGATGRRALDRLMSEDYVPTQPWPRDNNDDSALVATVLDSLDHLRGCATLNKLRSALKQRHNLPRSVKSVPLRAFLAAYADLFALDGAHVYLRHPSAVAPPNR